MGYHYIDMDTYKRKQHFEYFSGLSYPYVGITADVDISGFPEKVKAKGFPFFLTLCYCVSRAANAVPEFRQRIERDRIKEYDRCQTSHTVALEDGTYCYCTLEDRLPLEDYIPYAIKEQETAKRKRSVEDNQDDRDELLFISTLPWISYRSLIQPVPIPADSNPRITWGRFFQQEGKTLLPLTVLCHHALVDGLHMAAFYKELETYIHSVI